MADRANLVVVRESGAYELYLSRFGAIGLDLDLLAGPEAALAMAEGLRRDDWWLDDELCQAAALIDLGRRVLLLFVWEGPSVVLRHRAAYLELLRAAWPGWEIRWLYDGPAELRAHVGLDQEYVRCRDSALYPGEALEPGDEELAGPEPLAAVVTIGVERCHVVVNLEDHPVREGPALLDRLAGAPEHGVCRVPAEAGLHVDPVRRHVGWWVLGASAEAYEAPGRWPGWTVEFWRDDWRSHVHAADGRFCPPEPDHARALEEVRAEEADRRARRGNWASPWA